MVNDSLYFNILFGHDYVYVMNVMVSSLFRMIYFPHNGNIVTIDQLASDNHRPNLNLVHNIPWCVPSVQVDFASP